MADTVARVMAAHQWLSPAAAGRPADAVSAADAHAAEGVGVLLHQAGAMAEDVVPDGARTACGCQPRQHRRRHTAQTAQPPGQRQLYHTPAIPAR